MVFFDAWDAAKRAREAVPLAGHGEIGKGRRDSNTISKHKADTDYILRLLRGSLAVSISIG